MKKKSETVFDKLIVNLLLLLFVYNQLLCQITLIHDLNLYS